MGKTTVAVAVGVKEYSPTVVSISDGGYQQAKAKANNLSPSLINLDMNVTLTLTLTLPSP